MAGHKHLIAVLMMVGLAACGSETGDSQDSIEVGADNGASAESSTDFVVEGTKPGGESVNGERRVERIEFARGTNRTTVEEQIQGYEVAHYRVSGRAGQRIDVTLETDHSATYFNILPAGHLAGRDAATFRSEVDGNRYAETLEFDGDVTIEVYMMRSAARRDEVASYTLDVGIEGKPREGGMPPPSGPWPVDTDVSGELPCTIGGDALDSRAFDRRCAFKAKRNSYGVTIWVVPPGESRAPGDLAFGDLRVVYFEGKQPGSDGADLPDSFSTDDAGEVDWDRSEDNWIVSVDGGAERYLVPDAVIWGG